MEARIITIGDELLIGQVVDTNSAWISARLNEAGVRVAGRVSVADDAHDIMKAFDDALSLADVVIVTGGLGPTKDDITKKTLAEYFGCGMREDRQVSALIEKMLAGRNIAFNDLNRSQAMVPDCCTVLPNYNGTAPGMWFERNGEVLVSLPGVPFEMKALMENEVIPRLKKRFGLEAIVHKTLITQGIAESVLATTIAGWEDALPSWLRLAYLPNTSGVRLRLSSYGVDADEAGKEIEERFGQLQNIIPGYIIGYGDENVASVVAAMLTEQGKTLAVAESCTGGAVASAFTAMAGASEYFLCGVVSYSNEAKIDVLGVDAGVLEKHGAVSREVAEQMAAGARRIAGADYAVATTGIAGPTGGTPEKPVGTVWIAVAGPEGVVARKMMFGALRQPNIERATASAINMLRLALIGKPDMAVTGGVL